ncbi:transcriptional regulator, MarR family [Fibrisoma limi BUZ 3]|uniref:Transcriptional regulator, MarR family n=1 Tax=Fibrisoma limi BUZ 3 TaxID=1185876 RepID=I2GPI7_9BACT|nr:winged helix DNA-binding protein [Fibrisoma limi]CCH55815.1 transcriptional regulator, MarR family [Fibrisoma limi BUZ 3]
MAYRKNPVIELVKAWELFEQTNAGDSIEDFCRYYLRERKVDTFRQAVNETSDEIPTGMRPSDALVVVVARVNKYTSFYTRKVMQHLPVDNGEDFAYLATLHFEGGMRKGELINANISEFTTGTNVINRLLKHGLVEEFPDPVDARSKQVKITDKGVQWIHDCMPDMLSVTDLLMNGVLTDEEMRVAFLILNKLDRYHAPLFAEFRTQKVDEIRERLASRQA